MGKSALLPKQPWKIDTSIDADRVSLEDVKLIFTQAEKRLDDTLKTGESIASKTMSMITLMTGVLIALCGFIISNWGSTIAVRNKNYAAVAGSIYLLALLIYMIKNVLPNRYFVLGSEPEQLMIPSFFSSSVPKEKITVFIYMSEIENYNLRINKNLQLNNAQRRRYRLSVILFLVFPIMLSLAYGLLEWLY